MNYTFILPTRQNAETLYNLYVVPAFDAGEPLLVAEEGGVLLGASLATSDKSPFVQSERCAVGIGTYVSPTHRRKGVATDLRKEVVVRLRALGFTAFQGVADANNTASITSTGRLGAITAHTFTIKL